MKKKLTEQDKLFIANNKDKMTINELAVACKSTPVVISNYIDKKLSISSEIPITMTEKSYRARLINSFAWKTIKKQFDLDELDVLQERYVQLMEQFKDDVEATEEKQILEMIKLEILMDRNHNERQNIRGHLKQLKDLQRGIFSNYHGNYDQMPKEERDQALALEGQINTNVSAESSKTQELLKLQEKHANLMRDLKGTRDQRFDTAASSKMSFLDLVKSFIDKQAQIEESKATQLLQEAALNEYKKLGAPIQYADEQMDSPILSPETI